MTKLRFVALVSLLLIDISSAAGITAKFSKTADDYVCRVTGQSYTRQDTLVKMYGKHQKKDENGNPTKFSNADVTVFMASYLNNDFEKIPPNVVHLFPNLKVMNLEEISLKELDSSSFKGAKNLKRIIFGKDHIETIGADVFSDCESLEEVQFNENAIDTIDDNAFVGQGRLKILVFNANNISHFSRILFEPLTGLIELTISGNPVKEFHPNLFFGMKNLRVLHLNNNELTHLSSDWLKDKEQLSFINLNFNQIATIDSNILTIWPNRAGIYLLDNECISKSFDQLGGSDWPIDKVTNEMKDCFNDSPSKSPGSSVSKLETKPNATSSSESSSVVSSESSESIEEKVIDNKNETSFLDWFAHDDKTHDEDSEIDIKEEKKVTESVVQPAYVDFKDVDKNSTKNDDYAYDEEDDESWQKVPATEVPITKATKKTKETKKPNVETKGDPISVFFSIPIKEANDGKPEASQSSTTPTSTTPTSSSKPEENPSETEQYLHSYEQTQARLYLSARKQYTCVLENIEPTLKRIITEHRGNYSNQDVTVVFVRESRLVNIPPVIFDSFPNLKSLSVEESGIKTMDSDLFEKCGKLEHLDLSNNKIERIRGDSLDSCTALESVDLSGNPIENIDGKFFHRARKLKVTIDALNIVAEP